MSEAMIKEIHKVLQMVDLNEEIDYWLMMYQMRCVR